jgi:hypothetical protein
LTDEQRAALLNNQSTQIDKIGNSISSIINQLGGHQINEQNILEQPATMPIIQTQIQVD